MSTKQQPESITCPRCGAISWNPTAVAEGYCGACHDWTSTPTRTIEVDEWDPVLPHLRPIERMTSP